jgi:hypothetical protein
VLKQAGDLTGKVIISCSLPMNASGRPIRLSRGTERHVGVDQVGISSSR